MIDWNQNETMKKLGHLIAISADTPEGEEVQELMQGMGAWDSNTYTLASFAYSLGIVRGKQIERARRKQAG